MFVGLGEDRSKWLTYSPYSPEDQPNYSPRETFLRILREREEDPRLKEIEAGADRDIPLWWDQSRINWDGIKFRALATFDQPVQVLWDWVYQLRSLYYQTSPAGRRQLEDNSDKNLLRLFQLARQLPANFSSDNIELAAVGLNLDKTWSIPPGELPFEDGEIVLKKESYHGHSTLRLVFKRYACGVNLFQSQLLTNFTMGYVDAYIPPLLNNTLDRGVCVKAEAPWMSAKWWYIPEEFSVRPPWTCPWEPFLPTATMLVLKPSRRAGANWPHLLSATLLAPSQLTLTVRPLHYTQILCKPVEIDL